VYPIALHGAQMSGWHAGLLARPTGCGQALPAASCRAM